MSTANPLEGLNDCGCCEGLEAQTPVAVTNPPGLSSIAYRVGTHAQFKQSLLAGLATAKLPSLQALQTRDDDDFAIALLDAWATVADVLTFYQERIANEFYLHTATEPVSLLHLARLIGYELRPGVAASTYLAFTLEDAPGAPEQGVKRAIIDVGTKVQSLPGPDEQPQTFETIEKIEARTEWNALKPKLTTVKVLGKGDTQFYLTGPPTAVQMPGNLLPAASRGDSKQRTVADPKPGDLLLFIGKGWEQNKASDWCIRQVEAVQPDYAAERTLVTWRTASLSSVPDKDIPSDPAIYVFRQRAAIFGHNAPDWRGMADSIKNAYTPGYDPTKDKEWPHFDVTKDNFNLDAVYPLVLRDSLVLLSAQEVPPGSAAVWHQKLCKVNSVVEESKADFTLTASTTKLTLPQDDNLDDFKALRRETVVFVQSERLDEDIAEAPNPDSITGASVTLDRWVDGLTQGQWLIVEGKDEQGTAISEVVSLSSTPDPKDELTTLNFSQGLRKVYQRDSVTIYANVVRATHGETTSEVLGSGDATQPYQRFTLHQAPLTYTSAPKPSGAESTLQVRVNDVLWHEAPTLYGCGPRERVFVTRASEGKTTIEFGDGQTGARLPSGQENVRATYRKGIGRGGQVKAGQLSLLMSRPLGVKGVTNPQDASGAQDPEALDDARRNAPLTIQTLDRLVSLQDYEDFALAFSGIAKALATWTWSGQGRGVFITVAGLASAEVSSDSALYRNLLMGMQSAGDPYMPLRVQSYRQAWFRVAASIKVDPDYFPERVLAEVAQALRSRFSFAARAFGQPVLRSEVIAVMQAVPGVVAVDLNALYRSPGEDKTFGALELIKSPLVAELPQAGAAEVVAAELLVLLDSEPPDLRVMS